MTASEIVYRVATACVDDIHQHLLACDKNYTPALSARLNIGEYAKKLESKARNFEAWNDNRLIGLVSVYLNSASGIAFISNVSVVSEFTGHGIASSLIERALVESSLIGCHDVALEVSRDAAGALALYGKLGFVTSSEVHDSNQLKLTKSICRS